MPETLSVIIPTYNRRDLLAKTLDGYLNQSAADQIGELVIIDDGSTDDTRSMVERFVSRALFPVRYLWQPNKGPAAARNAGIREARMNLILFTDSDIIPHPDLVAQHVDWHKQHPQPQMAVLGYVTWPIEIRPTPFMRWYGEGKLFVFDRLRGQREADFQCFYTCNLSLKAAFLRANGQFDESFVTAAYEDTELGYRLSKRGLRLLYNPAAIGYHYQFFSFEDACRKARANAEAAQLFFRKESGQKALQTIRQRRSRPGYAIARTAATAATKMLSPARPLLNSYTRLPNIIYQLFYWHDATRLVSYAELQEPGSY
jgi:glycosyltransferase involved in cell wall biosynthesis